MYSLVCECSTLPAVPLFLHRCKLRLEGGKATLVSTAQRPQSFKSKTDPVPEKNRSFDHLMLCHRYTLYRRVF